MRRRITLLMVFFCALPVTADLELRNAWSRATPPGMPMGAVYGNVVNTGESPVKVTGLRTDVARGAEIHESVDIDGMMRMREVTPFVVEPGQTVSLQPGGRHIMLMGLKSALVSGQTYPLVIETPEGLVAVEVKVGGYGQMSAPE